MEGGARTQTKRRRATGGVTGAGVWGSPVAKSPMGDKACKICGSTRLNRTVGIKSCSACDGAGDEVFVGKHSKIVDKVRDEVQGLCYVLVAPNLPEDGVLVPCGQMDDEPAFATALTMYYKECARAHSGATNGTAAASTATASAGGQATAAVAAVDATVDDSAGTAADEEEEEARPSRIPSLCTHFTRAGIEWRR